MAVTCGRERVELVAKENSWNAFGDCRVDLVTRHQPSSQVQARAPPPSPSEIRTGVCRARPLSGAARR
ncbi:hypothetical protein JG688_00012095 [Phytophthora aleatoria]|uniref:Uncharacterized protein n=1 Tax=Phytophthora aleatoria TaxID=2496075 RepID=A0A8J5M093_9STRA|nr:hypothetical protein JG688_00012095 [Phytophthora aleatoria]